MCKGLTCFRRVEELDQQISRVLGDVEMGQPLMGHTAKPAVRFAGHELRHVQPIYQTRIGENATPVQAHSVWVETLWEGARGRESHRLAARAPSGSFLTTCMLFLGRLIRRTCMWGISNLA